MNMIGAIFVVVIWSVFFICGYFDCGYFPKDSRWYGAHMYFNRLLKKYWFIYIGLFILSILVGMATSDMDS